MASTSYSSPDADVNAPPYQNSFQRYFGACGEEYLQSPPHTNSNANSTGSTPPVDPTKASPAEEQHQDAFQRAARHRARHRQLYEPNGPMYVPAALRPTEPPVKHSPPKHGIKPMGRVQSCPPTPPGSSGGENDRDRNREEFYQRWIDESVAKKTMTRVIEDEWRELEKPTGAPTKEHWKVWLQYRGGDDAQSSPAKSQRRKIPSVNVDVVDADAPQSPKPAQGPSQDATTDSDQGSSQGQSDTLSPTKPKRPANSPINDSGKDNENGDWWAGSYHGVHWTTF
ncbi:MAG: hypothetical protein Q9162_007247 [Coniocarpon cinnabarinum]